MNLQEAIQSIKSQFAIDSIPGIDDSLTLQSDSWITDHNPEGELVVVHDEGKISVISCEQTVFSARYDHNDIFTAENTNGFSASDLEIMNAAATSLIYRGFYEVNAASRVNNNWVIGGINTIETLTK